MAGIMKSGVFIYSSITKDKGKKICLKEKITAFSFQKQTSLKLFVMGHHLL